MLTALIRVRRRAFVGASAEVSYGGFKTRAGKRQLAEIGGHIALMHRVGRRANDEPTRFEHAQTGQDIAHLEQRSARDLDCIRRRAATTQIR